MTRLGPISDLCRCRSCGGSDDGVDATGVGPPSCRHGRSVPYQLRDRPGPHPELLQHRRSSGGAGDGDRSGSRREPVWGCHSHFVLCVSRLLGYKNVDQVVAAFDDLPDVRPPLPPRPPLGEPVWARAVGQCRPLVLSTIWWPKNHYNAHSRQSLQGAISRSVGTNTFDGLRIVARSLIAFSERPAFATIPRPFAWRFRRAARELLRAAALVLPNSSAEQRALESYFDLAVPHRSSTTELTSRSPPGCRRPSLTSRAVRRPVHAEEEPPQDDRGAQWNRRRRGAGGVRRTVTPSPAGCSKKSPFDRRCHRSLASCAPVSSAAQKRIVQTTPRRVRAMPGRPCQITAPPGAMP